MRNFNPFRKKDQQTSSQEMNRRNQDQRETPRRDDKKDFLGISVLGYHKTLINNPFRGKRDRR